MRNWIRSYHKRNYLFLLSKALEDINHNLPTIAVAHHNLDMFSYAERRKTEIELKKNNIFLYLCGHSHQRASELIVKYNQQKRLNVFTCGTLMAEDHSSYLNTVFFKGTMNLTERSGKVFAYKWNLENEWHEDKEFGLVQDIDDNFRFFSDSSIDQIGEFDLTDNVTHGMKASILSHLASERQKVFANLNADAKSSLSIYGVGITSVSKNTELLDKILENGGSVRLCMVDPEVFKSDNCENVDCTIVSKNFCVYSDHIDTYIRQEYYDDIQRSYKRVMNYKEKAKEKNWDFSVRLLPSFVSLSINIINENDVDARLILECNFPFTSKRLLMSVNKNKDSNYFNEIMELFEIIWNKARTPE